MSRIFNQCPRCALDLAEGATSCSCGWKKRGARVELPRRPPIACAHEGCEVPALVSLKLRTGWANVCRGHYEFHIQKDADEFNRKMGLDTREKQRAFVAEKLVGLGRKGLPLREPGQDDEERVA